MIQKKEKKTPIKGEAVKRVKESVCSGCKRDRPHANFRKKLCLTCYKKYAKEKAQERKAVKREKKRLSISQLTKKLDIFFSLYIRLVNSDNQGRVKCFTCDRQEYFKAIQNGHFQSRRFMSTRFHEHNCAPQCYACNVGLSGMQYEFGKRLDIKYGTGMADKMVLLSKQVKKYTTDEMLDLIEHYKNKVEDLKRQKSIFD